MKRYYVSVTETLNKVVSVDADTVEEAKKSALDNFIAKFRAMEPKKNWSKKPKIWSCNAPFL